MGSPVTARTSTRRTASRQPLWTQNSSLGLPLSSSCSAWSRQVLELSVMCVTATTTTTAVTPFTSRTHLMSPRQRNLSRNAPMMAKNTSAGKSFRTCVEMRESSEAVATSRTRRTGTATRPC